jgi:hypothetical protein
VIGTGNVQRVNLTNLTLEGGAIPVGGDLRNVVITPDGATALVADYEGRVLYVNLATAAVAQTIQDLSAYDTLGSIDIEPNGLAAWGFDSATNDLIWIHVPSRTVGIVGSVNSDDINGKWIGKPVFYDTGGVADTVLNDNNLTNRGFGRRAVDAGATRHELRRRSLASEPRRRSIVWAAPRGRPARTSAANLDGRGTPAANLRRILI